MPGEFPDEVMAPEDLLNIPSEQAPEKPEGMVYGDAGTYGKALNTGPAVKERASGQPPDV